MQTVNPAHTAIVPFDELTPAVQDEDLPYLRAIHRTAARLNINTADPSADPRRPSRQSDRRLGETPKYPED